jgi:predicted ATP-dependent serine protease
VVVLLLVVGLCFDGLQDLGLGAKLGSMRTNQQVKFCKRCESPVPQGKFKCGKCGMWVLRDAEAIINRAVEGVEDDGTILLSNVKSAAADRLCTPICGAIWGTSKLDDGTCINGVVRTSVTLLGGMRGAGKSTLLTKALSEFSIVLNRETMYITCEESLPEIKLRSDRIEIPNPHQIRMVEALSGCSSVAQLIENRKPCAVVLDSLRGLVGSDQGAALEACKLCKVLAVDNHCPIIIVQHVTKDEQISGSNDDQHEVDTVMTFFPTVGDIRLLEVQKNRFGRAFIGQKFLMTDQGLRLVGDLVLPDADNPTESDPEE